jgi:hypothetical protein
VTAEREVEIARPPEEVFAFVSDPLNVQLSDVDWKLPRVLAVIGDRMVPRHLAGQVKALKRELEGR